MQKSARSRFENVHRKKRSGPDGRITVLFGILFTFTIIFTLYCSYGSFGRLAGSAAVLSARLTVPQGGAEVMAQKIGTLQNILLNSSKAANQSADKKSAGSSSSSSSSSSQASASSASSSSSASSAGKKAVKTVQFGTPSGSQYESYGNICVYNQTAHHKADIASQLAIAPDVHINLKSPPQVLIVHTHTTESFADSDTGYYDPNADTRNIDKSKSVVKVGDEITQALQQNGIGVVHDTAYNDYPEYNGAYDRSLATVQNDMKKYPSIKVVLDIHRDAIEYTDGTKVKPTAVINGKKAAQVMVVSACDEAETSLSVPDWQWNYRFALRIQQQLVKTYPGLARPLNLCPRRYNMQVSHGALLIEFGTDVNTLDEVSYSGQLFGQVLSQVLLGLQG